MAVVYLGIGSNLGDKQGNCLDALERLSTKGVSISKRSALYNTQPWGVKDQPDFVNMAVEAETLMSPEELLGALKEIEREMGRKTGIRWGPRVIDLDVLLYDDKIVQSKDLVIPHPLLHKRDFVLLPLAEISPECVHPVLNKTIRELAKELIKRGPDNETNHIDQQQVED
jgi:2-amino-4-hydroxy-6-hydroxymethyldihydropteridine diphosphokinase